MCGDDCVCNPSDEIRMIVSPTFVASCAFEVTSGAMSTNPLALRKWRNIHDPLLVRKIFGWTFEQGGFHVFFPFLHYNGWSDRRFRRVARLRQRGMAAAARTIGDVACIGIGAPMRWEHFCKHKRTKRPKTVRGIPCALLETHVPSSYAFLRWLLTSCVGSILFASVAYILPGYFRLGICTIQFAWVPYVLLGYLIICAETLYTIQKPSILREYLTFCVGTLHFAWVSYICVWWHLRG